MPGAEGGEYGGTGTGAIGAGVGSRVGTFVVGAGVGSRVGVCVGVGVGSRVGACVIGVGVGDFVGDGVGLGEGTGNVGTREGPEDKVPLPDITNTITNPSAVTELSDVNATTNGLESMLTPLDCPKPLKECARLPGLTLLPR